MPSVKLATTSIAKSGVPLASLIGRPVSRFLFAHLPCFKEMPRGLGASDRAQHQLASMSSREESATHGACELCRLRKRRCDGDGSNPCKACRERALDCVYVFSPRVSKADLREELARLQSATLDDNALLDSISSKETSAAQLDSILHRLSDGQSRADVASFVSLMPAAASRLRPDASWVTPSTVTTATATPPSMLMEGLSSQPSAGPSTNSPPTSLEAFDDSANAAEFRANLGYYRSQLLQLLSTILARECLSFCPVSERELERELATHASTALADALLAIGAVLTKDHPRLATALLTPGSLDPDSLGQAFAYEAIIALHNGTGRPRRVADIQALGVLSLYALTCDKLQQGREFAADFCAAIAELWRAEPSSEIHKGSLADKEALASIYCAAVSLNRVLFLISDYNMTLDAYTRSVCMDDFQAVGDTETAALPSQLNLSNSIIDDAFFHKDLSSIPDNPRVIVAKLFELAEWTYLARSGPQQATFEGAVQVYSQGLRWYETFFQYTSGCGKTNTSLILFVHTFYHFCVLCLLTPHILESVPIARDGTRADTVCKQAADSICELITHYRQLHGGERLLGFVPMFESAARASLGEARTSR